MTDLKPASAAAFMASGVSCGQLPRFFHPRQVVTGSAAPRALRERFAFATEPFVNDAERKRVLKTYKTLGIGWPNTQSTIYYGTDPVTFSTLSTVNVTQTFGEKYRSPYTDYIDIISDKLSQYMKVRDGETTQVPETDILCRVFLTPPNSASTPDISGNQLGTRPFKMTWDPNTTKFFRWTPNEAIYDFDIQVKDMYGDLVPWSGKWPFEFHMNMLASET